MRNEGAHRRYLIAVGITTDLRKSGPRIVDSVTQMTRTFTTDFGYERATSLDIDPGLEQIRTEIRKFCLDRDEDDVVALYYTGHADEVNGKHRVWAGDTSDNVSGTLETAHLAELMLVGTPLRHALIILDTCFAGQGGAEALLASVPSVGEGGGKTLALLTAAYPREQIVAGDFARLFTRAVEGPAVAGHEPPYLSVGAIARLMDEDSSRPRWQSVSHSVLLGKTDHLPFFPNRRFNRQLHGLDLLTQLRIEQQELRAADMAGHFLPRARGVDVPAEPGWRFVGREVALGDIVTWLRGNGRTSRIVTGGPGSGKSALIGRLVVLSDHYRRPTVPTRDLAEQTIPPEGSIATGIHARGLTTAQVLSAVCAAVGATADTGSDLLREMREQETTIAIDAVDEALDPSGLISAVLKPLLEAGPAKGLRLLLGTRPHLLVALGAGDPVIDLDDERYADPESLREYVLRGLESDDRDSPFHAVSAETATGIAEAVAQAAGHSFLVARIVSRTLLSASQVPDPEDPQWRARLPATAADAMHADLESRLGSEAEQARDLLRPLAFANGAGLPWEDVWAALASKLSGHNYTDDHLVWLRQQAGSYVVEAMESGQSVYRLYHAALAEYLRQGCDERVIDDLYCAFLIHRVPVTATGPDWSRAHPYTLAHLATHARRAGKLDELLLDPGYLVHAAPAGLLAALPGADVRDARLAAEAYQRALHQLRDRPEDHRFSYLELASRITKATMLTRRIEERAPRRSWSVPWTHWPPEYPHRILGGQLGQINDVACAVVGGGKTVVASVGQDARLRLWDLATAEPEGSHAIGTAPLVAMRFAHLPGNRTVVGLLGADGRLHIWDASTASVSGTFSVASRWRRLLRLHDRAPALRTLRAQGAERFAVVSGRGMATSVWDLSAGRRAMVLPDRLSPDKVWLAELVDGRMVIAGRGGGEDYWVGDPATGQRLPPLSGWLRRFLDNRFGWGSVAYYALPDGRPAIAARFFRRGEVVLWDLTDPSPLGRWVVSDGDIPVRLADGQNVRVPAKQGKTAATQAGDSSNGVVPLVAMLDAAESSGNQAPGSTHPEAELSGRFVRLVFSDHSPTSPPYSEIALTLAGHTANVTACTWIRLPDHHLTFVTGSDDGTVRRWDVTSIKQSPGEHDERTQTALRQICTIPAPDGTPLGVTVGSDPEVSLWDLGTGRLLRNLDRQGESLCTLCVARPSVGDPIAITFNTDATSQVWALPGAELTAQFRTHPIRWPASAACHYLPDGTCVAVTAGHGRKVVIWDVAKGQMRHVAAGHAGWSSCVTCAQDARARPIALTGGHDNRVNVWDLRTGRRRNRFRIASRWAFWTRPAAGHANSIRIMTSRDGGNVVFVATGDGQIRVLRPRRFMPGARRIAEVTGTAIALGTVANGRPVAVISQPDGVLQAWAAEDLARKTNHRAPLCEVDVEITATDICAVDDGMFVIATPNGLTAIRLYPRIFEPILGLDWP
jgi:WD40 repeat protein